MRTQLFLSVGLLLFFTSQLRAQGTVTPPENSNPDSALQDILASIGGYPLKLHDAVETALGNSTSLRRQEAAYLSAEGSRRRESGTFDPQLFFNLHYQDLQQPTASFFAGAPTLATLTTTSRSGLRMSLPTGTQLELALSTVRLHTNSSLAFINPEYDAFGSLSLRQPLLGGFAASARKLLTQSERQSEAESARYDQEKISVSSDVERMYWDLYAAERDYAVQVLSRDRARAFLHETELRAAAGLVGPNQVANAKTFLSQQELQLVDRSEALDRQSDLLASLIGERPASGALRFIPTDEPPTNAGLDSADVLVEQARKNNLSLQAAQKDVEAARALANAASWEALPSVNLVGSVGGNGLGGVGQQVIILNDTLPVPATRSFGDALTQVSKRTFPNWSIGVEVQIPIGLRSGLGEKERQEAQVLSAEQTYIEQSRAVEDQVRSAHRELANGHNRVDVARTGVEAAQEQVRIGMIEFHNGRLTAFELVRLGEDLALAEQRFSEALVRTAKAAATLRELTSGGSPGK